jgi:hypothetical protein
MLLIKMRSNIAIFLLLNLSHPIKVLEIRAEPGKKNKCNGRSRRRWRRCGWALTGDGEDVVGRGISGGGEAETSPETGTVRLAARLPSEVRSRNLGLGCGGRRSVVVARVGKDRWV